MQVIECSQGSPEWHQARCGVITASMFVVVRKKVGMLDERQQQFVGFVRSGMSRKQAAEAAGYKAVPSAKGIDRALEGLPVGDYSDEAKNYAFRLAVERIGGTVLDEGFQTWQMKRGQELEPIARMEHEILTGVSVTPAGFVITDEGHFGASADGLIGEDGGSEYKCFVAPDRIRSIVLDGDWSEITDQVQGGMWITGRKWWDTCLYCPALEPIGKQLTHIRIHRDDDYIEALEVDLIEFNGLVQQYEQQLRQEAA